MSFVNYVLKIWINIVIVNGHHKHQIDKYHTLPKLQVLLWYLNH